MLRSALATHRGALAALARTWLAQGITRVSLWAEGQPLAQWPEASASASPRPAETLEDIWVPIAFEGRVAGHWRLQAPPAVAAPAQVSAETVLVADLVGLENELAGLTGELVDLQDQLLAIYDLTQTLHGQLDVEVILQSLAREAARLMRAGGAFVMLRPPEAPPVLVRHAADRLGEADIAALLQHVQASGRPLVVEADADRDGLPPLTVDNLLLVPMPVRESVIAGLGLFDRAGQPFASPDLKLAQALANQAGAQVENALLHAEALAQARLQAEMELARRAQTRLLPRRAPAVAGLDIYGESRPAYEVGGDFFDFIAQPDRPFTFVIGDVTGKGMSAAMVMAMMRTVIRNKANFLPSRRPSLILKRSNEDLYDDFTELGMLCTAFVAHFDAETGQLHYANAGHAPVIYCPAGGPPRLLKADSAAVGVLADCQAEDHLLSLGPGDMLVALTDGFSEASRAGGQMLGYEALLETAAEASAAHWSAAAAAAAFFDAAATFSEGQAQADDQTIVVIRGVPA